jgi:hypothetical protein
MSGRSNSISGFTRPSKLWTEQWWDPRQDGLLDAVGRVYGERRASVDETITRLKERILRLETTSNFEERFSRIAHEVKRGSELPRKSELLARINGLSPQVSDYAWEIWRNTWRRSEEPGKFPARRRGGRSFLYLRRGAVDFASGRG